MSIRLFTFIALSLICFSTTAQEIAIGQWKDYFSYNTGVSVARNGSTIYCATGQAIIKFSKDDNSIDRMTKVNDLSDVGVSALRYNTSIGMLVVGYGNGNIDLVKEDGTTNISAIKRSDIIGDKGIKHIHFIGGFAYLSTGFGIVVLDLSKEEVKDTYYIGNNGSQTAVNAVTDNGTLIYAATEHEGVKYASLSNPNLVDFNSWSQLTSIPNVNGPFNAITHFNGQLYVNFQNQNTQQYNSDTLYYYNGSNWLIDSLVLSLDNLALEVGEGKMIVTHNTSVDMIDGNHEIEKNVFGYTFDWASPKHAIVDGENQFWIADNRFGLVRARDTWNNEVVQPDGPGTNNVFNMHMVDQTLWIAPGAVEGGSWGNTYKNWGTYMYNEGSWTNFDDDNIAALDTVIDILSVVVDPNNTQHAFIGSWGDGLLEFTDGSLTNVYTHLNSSLQTRSPTSTWVGVAGMAIDDNSNLWVSNSFCEEPLSVKTASGTWRSFDFGPSLNDKLVANIVIDQSDQKWVRVNDVANGVLVFNDGGTPTDISDDNYRVLTTLEGNGNLPSNEVWSIAEDLDGEIWLGTNVGIAVIYSPENVFSGSNFDAQQILIEQDGNIQVLMETEIVTAIAVDGANRKWLGTQGSGVFLMSEDGTEQIHAFNEENSPLISNNIIDIEINHENGEILFATDKGIVAYRGTATKGAKAFNDVYAYPNPVRETYSGVVAIKGLLRDTDVKITDISGNLVFKTVSEGGQAIWDGTDFFGTRVQTGVYLVFCANEDGSETIATKILVVN